MAWLLKQTIQGFWSDNCFRSAAALAYYAVFAIGPLLVLAMTLAGLVLNPEQVTTEVERQLAQSLGDEGAAQIKVMIRQLQQAPASIQGAALSILAIVLGATGFLTELQSALNTAWNAPPDASGLRGLMLKRALQLVMILGIAGILLASVVISQFLSLVVGSAGEWVGKEAAAAALQALHFLATLLIHVLLFSALFRFVPDVHVAWGDAAAGGAFTALCFMLGRYAIGTYLASQNVGQAYGAAGSLVLVLLWVYYSTLILLLGAQFTQAWSQRHEKS